MLCLCPVEGLGCTEVKDQESQNSTETNKDRFLCPEATQKKAHSTREYDQKRQEVLLAEKETALVCGRKAAAIKGRQL